MIQLINSDFIIIYIACTYQNMHGVSNSPWTAVATIVRSGNHKLDDGIGKLCVPVRSVFDRPTQQSTPTVFGMYV